MANKYPMFFLAKLLKGIMSMDLAKKSHVFYLSSSYQKDFLTDIESRSLFIDMMPLKALQERTLGTCLPLTMVLK